MFTPVEIELCEFKKNNELVVIINPVPTINDLQDDKIQATQSVKPAVSWGWDWHPRLIPIGIWDETFLLIRNQTHIINSNFNYKLDKELNSADFTYTAKIQTTRLLNYTLTIYRKGNPKPVFTENNFTDSRIYITGLLKNIELWWPWDHGKQIIYTVSLTIFDTPGNILDKKNLDVGFRQIRLIMNKGTTEEPSGFPKTRRLPPVTLEINNRIIFLRGSNWVNPDIFWGRITNERYEKQLSMAREANFNILRVWGGSVINKDIFYKLCDAKGILVWQDFPLACNNYEGTPHYLQTLNQEANSIIEKLKNHPCLTIWCGGNELFNSWSGMDDQSKPLRLLNSICYEKTPDIPFIPTTPLEGMGHGHYAFRDTETGEDIFSLMNKSKFTAYSEFGNPSISDIEILKEIIPKNELFPSSPTDAWKAHHAFNAWDNKNDSWISLETQNHYFGKAENLNQMIERSQLLQSIGYKYIYEEARRQKPYCSMALNWCFNEPWPTAANNSLINYPDIQKPAFFAVKDACRPVLASARINTFQWAPGEIFECKLFILNDSSKIINPDTIEIILKGDNTVSIGRWNHKEISANKNLEGPLITCTLPDWKCRIFKLILKCSIKTEYNSEYTFVLKEPVRKGGAA